MPLLTLLRKFRETPINRMVDSKSDNLIKSEVSKISGKYKKEFFRYDGIVITIVEKKVKVTEALHNVTL